MKDGDLSRAMGTERERAGKMLRITGDVQRAVGHTAWATAGGSAQMAMEAITVAGGLSIDKAAGTVLSGAWH